MAFILFGILFFSPDSSFMSKAETDDLRILFIGDSRTVDMFSSKEHEIKGEEYDNITVYAKDGATYSYMTKTLKKVNVRNYDIVVTWMGTNDHGNFTKYGNYYKKLKKKNVNLLLCTLGYSDNNRLGDEGDHLYYNDGIMQKFNKQLTKWAKKNEVKTINLYSYTKKKLKTRENNGVHYVPCPTTGLWKYTVRQIRKKADAFDIIPSEA